MEVKEYKKRLKKAEAAHAFSAGVQLNLDEAE